MREAAWTKGPWRANSSWIEGPQMALRVACIDWPKRGCAPKTVDEAKANARLIAAAPELFEALRCFLDDPRFHVAVGGNPIVVDEMLSKARAALSRALGSDNGGGE